MQIQRGQTKFLYGINDHNQLQEIMSELQPLKGIAVVGRSNVGKSSLINALFGNKTAVTSKTPGRTRQVNVFQFTLHDPDQPEFSEGPFWLFDLPGYGHAEISKQMAKVWSQLMECFFLNLSQEICLFNIQDVRHPHQKADLEFQKYLINFDIRPWLIFNKLDKLKKQSEKAKLKNQQQKILKESKLFEQVHYVSAEKKDNLNALEQALTSRLLGQSIAP